MDEHDQYLILKFENLTEEEAKKNGRGSKRYR